MSTHICVTICTRERPKMLSRCLASVLPQLEASPFNTSLVIVENGDEPACREDVLRLRERFTAVRIDYELEPELGIPFARNKAVEAALKLHADWIVFIDDDEEARPDWFEKLTDAIGKWKADVFHGPVELIYPDNHPEWMRMKSFDGGAAGTILETAATNNTMASSWLFAPDGLGLRFDIRLRFTGGSDVDLFRRAVKAGAIIRWLDNVLVTERIFERRLSAKWLLGRTRREAANISTFTLDEHGFAAALRLSTARCGRLTMEIAYHTSMFALTVVWREISYQHLFKIRKKFAKASGYLFPLLGHSLKVYHKVEGE